MARSVRKLYLALCHGAPSRDQFVCEGRIGRNRARPTQMTVMRRPGQGREARTDFKVLRRFPPDRKAGRGAIFLVLAKPHTGRTHQIRVHLAKAGFPVLADETYGKEAAIQELGLKRQALHAWRLEFDHPRTGKRMLIEAPLADDIRSALEVLGGKWPL